MRGTLYIQLSKFPNHYLVLVITDDHFRYALITTRLLSDSTLSDMVMEDIAWLDFSRIHSEEMSVTSHTAHPDFSVGAKRTWDSDGRDVVVGETDSVSS